MKLGDPEGLGRQRGQGPPDDPRWPGAGLTSDLVATSGPDPLTLGAEQTQKESLRAGKVGPRATGLRGEDTKVYPLA